MGKGSGPTGRKVHPGAAEPTEMDGKEEESATSPSKMSRKERAKMKYQTKRKKEKSEEGESEGADEKHDGADEGGSEEAKTSEPLEGVADGESTSDAKSDRARFSQINRAVGHWAKLKAVARVLHDYEMTIENHRLSHVTRDLFEYACFLTLFLLVVFMGRTSEPFFMVQTLENYITTNEYSPGSSFYTIKNNIQVFDWFDNIFLPVMFPTQTATAGYDLSCEEQQYMGDGFVNRRVGAIRLRALRIQKDTCEIPNMFEKATDRCFGVWKTDFFGNPTARVEETDQVFGNKWMGKAATGTETIWSDKDETEATIYMSSSTKNLYHGTGYVELLPNNYELAVKRMRQLFRGTWIDYQNRAVFVEFLVYNTASNNLVSCRLFIEYGPEGDIFTDASFHVSETYNQYLGLQGDSSGNWYVLVGGWLEIGLYLFVGYQTMKEMLIFWFVRDKAAKKRKEMKEHPENTDYQPAHHEVDIWNLIRNKTDSEPWELEYRQTLQKHFFDVYNLLQYVNLALFGCAFICRVMAYVEFRNVSEDIEKQIIAPCKYNDDGCGGTYKDWTLLDDNGDPKYEFPTKYGYCTPEFVSMFNCEWYEVQYRKFIALNSVLLFFKFFRYVRFYHKFAVVIETLKVAAGMMTTLVLVMIIVLVGFAVSYHIAFGYRSDRFKELGACIIALVEFTLGEFGRELDDLRAINRSYGPIFFILFVAVMVFVIMSMFFALTANAYEGVQARLQEEQAQGQTEEMTAVLDDVVFIADWLRRKLPFGKKLLPDAHAMSVRLSHRPTWVPDDDHSHPVARTRRYGEKPLEDEEAEEVPETEEEELDRLGFKGAEREFVVSMKAPKHSMLTHLVAFEEQQRDMLHAIEALNKRARETAIAKELELNDRRKAMAGPGPGPGPGPAGPVVEDGSGMLGT